MSVRAAGLLVLLAAGASKAHEEVLVPLEQGGQVGLSTRGPSAFRVRFLFPDVGGEPMWTPMVEPDKPDAEFEVIMEGDKTVGISSNFGKVQVTSGGTMQLYDSSGRMVTESAKLSEHGPLALSSRDGQLYGRGASPDDARSFTSRKVQPMVCNRATYTPYYWSTDGYGALGVVQGSDGSNLQLAYESDGQAVTWRYQGALEMYFLPASMLKLGTQALYELIGKPSIPPKFVFGFTASRWGWESVDYVEETLGHFREWSYPIDAFIIDFEWFTKESDYTYTPEGKSWYADFGYNPQTFPEPQAQLAAFKRNHFRFGGIRKPRLGNTHLLNWAKSKGWILPGGEPSGSWPPDVENPYALQRNLDFAQKEVRDFYAWNMANFTTDGVDFWWNDEGEDSYFTFHWWNVAEMQALRMKSQSRRFFSLNRAWTLGMARLGATVWTGDIDPTWKDLAGTPGMMLNWILSGAPYVACDIGGFTRETEANLLVRWYQLGVFMPMMRVHSTKDATPHWPWLWGDEPASAMKHALELRYRLLPYHYSLAYAMYKNLSFWVRPLVMDMPDDSNVWSLTAQWFDGSMLASPCIREDSQKEVYFPQGTWYPLAATDSTKNSGPPIMQGPQRIQGDCGLDDIPVFVPAGAIITLGPIIQHTDAQPGGALEVQVYEGADGTFNFVEDDGESINYEDGQLKVTHFVWDDTNRRLSWSVTGFILSPGSRAFTELFATLVTKDGHTSSDTWPLGIVGSIDFTRDIAV